MRVSVGIKRLTELEKIIEHGLAKFVEVGKALLEIRDSRLYRETHVTFEAYCRERWRMSRSHAYRQIKAAEIAGLLSPIGDIPVTESQARALALMRDEPIAMVEAWREVSSTADLTAEKIREAVTRKMGVHYLSANDEWETPQDLFDVLNAEFKFELDVCALGSSAKCKRYFTPDDDGLTKDWGKGRCWMNPPYGDAIRNWVAKAYF